MAVAAAPTAASVLLAHRATACWDAALNGHDKVIVTLAQAKASIDEPRGNITPIAMAAQQNHEVVVRLLAHLGARLSCPDGDGFWLSYQDDDTRQRMRDFWRSVIDAGGDEPTEASRRTRRRLMNKAKMHDPRDGGPDEEPL
mgnify:CR=1 FL=1